MRKKKVLVHGTAQSLQEFFADAVSNDYEVVAILSEENISIEEDGEPVEVFKPQSLPKFIYELIDGIIITDAFENKTIVGRFLEEEISPRKLIIWDAKQGWGILNFPEADGTPVIYHCGLAFHIHNERDKKFFKEIHQYLQNQHLYSNLAPKLYPAVLAEKFEERTGKQLNFNNLQTFTEKLQWLKIYDATPLKSRLADKYRVRNWVAEKIGEEYLIPLLGVWDDFDDIDFDDLPDQFVLKCNHGCGMNIIVRDKKSFDKENAREKFIAWLALDYSKIFGTLELQYSSIDRKLIAEKFMTDGDAPELTDYKFWCFGGKVTYCKCMTERTSKLRIDYFDMNFHHMDYEQDNHPNSDHPERILPPRNFELMKELSTKLAEGFAFVRVDFYEIEGKVYFGEMTFTPGGGNFSYKSAGTDEYLGSLLKLPAPFTKL